MNRKIKIIDLFAGIGGIRLGFEKASNNNIECVFSSEWNKYSVVTYKANFGDEDIFGDITKVPIEKIPNHDINKLKENWLYKCQNKSFESKRFWLWDCKF